jgi:hypothetical protein
MRTYGTLSSDILQRIAPAPSIRIQRTDGMGVIHQRQVNRKTTITMNEKIITERKAQRMMRYKAIADRYKELMSISSVYRSAIALYRIIR